MAIGSLLREVIARPLPDPLRGTVGAMISGRLKGRRCDAGPGFRRRAGTRSSNPDSFGYLGTVELTNRLIASRL
ncbi:hypothetical protein ACH4K8_34925 [Streptomyces anulatus]